MARPLPILSFLAALLAIGGLPLPAASWSYSWTPGAAQGTPTAVVTPLLHDKRFAYCLEFDDTPVFVRTFAANFFDKYKWTDAPPGIAGGNVKPLVGTLQTFVSKVGANSTYCTWDQIRELVALGWGIGNHSFYHVGQTYAPIRILTTNEMREDLFWSQTLLAAEVGGGRAVTHFVSPNGYLPILTLLPEYGFHSGSRVYGVGGGNLSKANINYFDLYRSYLDEGNWAPKNDPLYDLHLTNGNIPLDEIVIDFTHVMDPNTNSANYLRWCTRMAFIESNFGMTGSNNLWNAPVANVVNYRLGRKVAALTPTANGFSVNIPDTNSGTPLTIKLTGIAPDTVLPPVPGGSVYRSGTTVWVTTPVIGTPGSPSPMPKVKMIYRGAVSNFSFSTPVELAAVIIRQSGKPLAVSNCPVNYEDPSGTVFQLGTKTLSNVSTYARLIYSAIPNGVAPTVRKVMPTKEATMVEMEIWALDQTPVGSVLNGLLPSFATNQSFTLFFSVNTNNGYVSTNGGTTWVSFSNGGFSLTLTQTTTVMAFGQGSATNSATYTWDTSAPAVTGAPPSATTNGPFSMNLSVNENSGFWSTNGVTWSSFPMGGFTLWVSNSTTLSYFGRDTLGNTSPTNSKTYTFSLFDLGISSANFRLIPVQNRADISYQLTISPGHTAQVTFEYKAGGATQWLPVIKNSIASPLAHTHSGIYTNQWHLPELHRESLLDVRMVAKLENNLSATLEFSNQSLAQLFGSADNLSHATLLLSPYRGEDPGIILAQIPADTQAQVMSAGGGKIAELRAGATTGRMIWNARKNTGEKVPPGVYLILVQSGSERKVLKAVVLPY